MAGLLLARGAHFDVESFLGATTLPADDIHVWTRGSLRPRNKPPLEDSGFNLWVTRDRTDWNDLDADVLDVLQFVRQHAGELARLRGASGVEEVHIDFALWSRAGTGGIFMQGEYLPADLLAALGNLNIGIALSLYPALDDDTD